MDLSLNEKQQLLRTTAADFVRNESPLQLLVEMDRDEKAFAPEVWSKVADLGWLGMMVPREHGGGESSLTDTAVVFEQLGKGPLPGPYFTSGVLSPLIIMEAGSEEQKRSLLPDICQGRRIVVPAITDPAPRWGPEAVQMTVARSNGDYVLDGTKLFVLDADSADSFICAVRTASGGNPAWNISLLLVDKNTPGISVRSLPGVITGLGEVNFESVRVPRSAVLGELGDGWQTLDRALQKALPIMCAYKVGGCDTVFNMALGYSQTRIVFTQPIGRFQRVQDSIIEAANAMDASRWTAYEALWKLDTGRPAESSVHLAKAVASEGYYQATNHSAEVFAGIGMSRELGVTLHIKMSRTLYSYLGDPLYHRRRMMDAVAAAL